MQQVCTDQCAIIARGTICQSRGRKLLSAHSKHTLPKHYTTQTTVGLHCDNIGRSFLGIQNTLMSPRSYTYVYRDQ